MRYWNLLILQELRDFFDTQISAVYWIVNQFSVSRGNEFGFFEIIIFYLSLLLCWSSLILMLSIVCYVISQRSTKLCVWLKHLQSSSQIQIFTLLRYSFIQCEFLIVSYKSFLSPCEISIKYYTDFDELPDKIHYIQFFFKSLSRSLVKFYILFSTTCNKDSTIRLLLGFSIYQLLRSFPIRTFVFVLNISLVSKYLRNQEILLLWAQ